jgi:hypothetical protein
VAVAQVLVAGAPSTERGMSYGGGGENGGRRKIWGERQNGEMEVCLVRIIFGIIFFFKKKKIYIYIYFIQIFLTKSNFVIRTMNFRIQHLNIA